MSFRPPRRPKRKEVSNADPLPSLSSTPSSPTTSRSTSPSKPSPLIHHHLVLPHHVPKNRRPRYSRELYLPGPERVFTLPGQDYSQIPSTSRGCTSYDTRIPRRNAEAGTSPNVFNDDQHRSSD